ncbi:MAG: WD40 repeat domain-containing protein [Acidobacteriota bacterium]
MSEVQNEQKRDQSMAERYPSFAALRDVHSELLKSDREMEDRLAFLDKVEEFCKRAQATGALLNLEDDRRASQSLLNYWVTTLYANGRMPGETILADFDSSLIPPIEDAACPYPGSRAFREGDAKNFFGRQTATDYILNRLKVDRLLTLIGPSGRGKTSLLLAGILPALRVSDNFAGRKRLYFPLLIPGTDPLGSLENMIKSSSNDSSQQVQSSSKSFKRNPKLLLELIKQTTDLAAVILVDQLEDLFTLCKDRKAQHAFIANLMSVVQEPGAAHIVIITMRSDSYDDEIKRLPKALRELLEPAKWPLPPLGADEIGDAIRKPAEMVGLQFQGSTVLLLIKEILSEPIGLPLLQFTLQKLWAKIDVNTIPEKALLDLGGCRAAFMGAADRFYKELKPEEQLTARQILMLMIKVDEEGKAIDAPVLRAELRKSDKPERVDSVLQRMVGEGLVRFSEHKNQDDVEVELVHNSLIRSWGEMAAWAEKKKSKQRLFKYAAKTFVGLAFVIGAVLLARAFLNWQADKRAFVSRQIAGKSADVLRTGRFDLASMLALHAYQIDKNVDSRGSVLNILRFGYRPLKFLAKENFLVADLALSRDKKKLASLDENGDISIWDIENEPSTKRVLASSVTASYPLVFSADGQTLASAYFSIGQNEPASDGASNITLWDVNTGASRNLFVDESFRARSIAFAPDGTWLISAGIDGRFARWDLRKDSIDKTPLVTFQNSVGAVTFNPQGTLLASGGGDGSTILWDARDWKRLKALGKPDRKRKRGESDDDVHEVSSISFSPDGKMLAVDGFTSTVIWEVASGMEVTSVSNDNKSFGLISAFSEDGQTLTSFSGDGNVFVWDVPGGSKLFHTNLKPSAFLALSSDGKLLALPNPDGITLWDLASIRTLAIPDENDKGLRNINALAFEPTAGGRTLAAGLNDGHVILWDAYTRKLIGRLEPTTESAATSLAFSPDGKLLAEGFFNGTSLLWDLATRTQHGKPFKGPTGTVIDLVFNPDGQNLAAITDPGPEEAPNILVLWSIKNGEQQVFENPGSSITSVAFSCDGKILFAGDTTGKISSIDTASRHVVNAWKGEDASIVSLQVDCTRQKLVSANQAGTLIVWDISDPSKIHQAGSEAGSVISGLAFSPAAGSLGVLRNLPDDDEMTVETSALFLVDLDTISQMGDPITSRSGSMTSFAFRSDGNLVGSTSTGPTIDLWNINPESAYQFCKTAKTNLSKKEWDVYVGGRYCRICSNIGPGVGAPGDAPACEYSGWRQWW